jgi:hypothetical protein
MKNNENKVLSKSARKVPLPKVETVSDKELERFGVNLATRPDVCSRFMEEFSGIINNTRNNRKTLEETWLDDMRQWSCRSDNRGYTGGFSNIFVPELNNQVESSVEKALTATFPGPDYIWAVPQKGTSEERAEKIKAAVLNEIENKNQIFVKWDEFERQKVLLGTSIFKGSFKKEMLDVYTRDTSGRAIKAQIPKHYGAKWDVVDLFRWYIYPETSELDTCLVTFEDQFMPISEAKKSGIYANMDQVQEVNWDTNHLWVDTERLELVYLATANKGRPGCAVFTEAWCDFEIRRGLKVPVVATIANHSVVVRLTRNPYWFQQNPYLAARYVRRPGKMFYGLSLPDKIRSQGYMMNDLTNQTMDSLNYSLAPITVIDPALAGDVNSFKVMPGAKWLGSPEGISFQTFPDVSGSGLRAMQEIRGQIAQFSDNSPGIAPQLQGKARSATQASLVQASVSVRQKVQGKSEESDVLSPMCARTHTMLVQFMDKEWPIKMQGPDAGSWITDIVQPTDLIGAVDFVWKGSSEAEKSAVRSQQLLAFYNAALQTATVLPPGELDLPALFRRIAKEAFDIKDLDLIFKSLRDKKTVDPELENIAIMDLQDVDINMGDNDDIHIKVVSEILENPKATDDQKMLALRHREKHELQKKAKAAIEQAKAKQEAIKRLQIEGPGSEGGQGPGGPAVPGIQEGNRGQAMSSPDAIMSSVKGVDSQ